MTDRKVRPEHPIIHCLKIWPEYYKAVLSGEKTFELRKNDRDFRVGDLLVLQEFDRDLNQYTGEMTSRKITYVTEAKPWLPEGLVIMSIVEYPS